MEAVHHIHRNPSITVELALETDYLQQRLNSIITQPNHQASICFNRAIAPELSDLVGFPNLEKVERGIALLQIFLIVSNNYRKAIACLKIDSTVKEGQTLEVNNMQQIQQRVIEVLQTLSPVDQQEVLDSVEFLRSKRQNRPSPPQATEPLVSALEIAGDLVGCLEGGPSDLSTNKKYLEGFGQE